MADNPAARPALTTYRLIGLADAKRGDQWVDLLDGTEVYLAADVAEERSEDKQKIEELRERLDSYERCASLDCPYEHRMKAAEAALEALEAKHRIVIAKHLEISNALEAMTKERDALRNAAEPVAPLAPKDSAYRQQLRQHIAAIDGRRPQEGHSETGFSTCQHPDCAALHAETGPAPQIDALIAKWRERAKTDARYGIGKAMTSDREYFGTVNAAFAIFECADELVAALRASAPRPEEE